MKIVFATNNPNKIKEVQAQLPNHIQLVSLETIGCHEDIPETQNTIVGNAIQKAEYIKERYGYDCFADDTGLEVEALDGAPGVFSARFAGPQRNAEDNMTRLLNDLKSKDNRSAQFKTVIALQFQGKLITFEGICSGEITQNKIGSGGFGYDPIFKPTDYKQTFAELSLVEKSHIGHRGKAVTKLVTYLNLL
ncbi:MAG: non-canonical purine NTP diphosphatase [Flavobacteriaceae bacterium]|jgi:XTP/dITP diphosphohydrolase|nr:non-canonical purine NTP diphosphatase [Flavobacteriaceae bacterium]